MPSSARDLRTFAAFPRSLKNENSTTVNKQVAALLESKIVSAAIVRTEIDNGAIGACAGRGHYQELGSAHRNAS